MFFLFLIKVITEISLDVVRTIIDANNLTLLVNTTVMN